MAVNKNNVKIHISHLKKNFGKLEVLKDVSTDIYEGEVVVVLGPSGSGKSTLLRCLNRLEEITGGEVIVDGHDMTDKKTDLNKVRQNVGMVFQHFNLFNNLDVMGNMTLAPTELKMATKAQATEKALQLLERVGLLDKASAYPAQLSGGQKQRVAIARGHESGHHALRRAYLRPGSGNGGRGAGRYEAAGRRRHDHGGSHP